MSPRIVYDQIPSVVLTSGGYSEQSYRTVARTIAAVVRCLAAGESGTDTAHAAK